jgi:hypothetical protein
MWIQVVVAGGIAYEMICGLDDNLHGHEQNRVPQQREVRQVDVVAVTSGTPMPLGVQAIGLGKYRSA